MQTKNNVCFPYMHKLFHKHLAVKLWKLLDSSTAQVFNAGSLELSHCPQSFVATCIGIFMVGMKGRVLTSCSGVRKVHWTHCSENPINEWLLLKLTSLVATKLCQVKHLGTKLAVAHLVNNLIEINCQKFCSMQRQSQALFLTLLRRFMLRKLCSQVLL